VDFTLCHVGGIQRTICCIAIKVNLQYLFICVWRYAIYYVTIISIGRDLDALTFKVCSHLRSAYPHHPMFTNGCDLNTMIRNGQSAIDRDLYKKSDAMNILTCISYVLFCNMKMLCYCSRNLNCYLLNRVRQMVVLNHCINRYCKKCVLL